MTKRCAQYEKGFAKLEAHCISLEPKSLNKSSISVQNGHVLCDKSDEAKIKFDTEGLETINIELEFSVAKKTYQNLFDSIKQSKEKKILFGNETSNFETKIKDLEMTLAQQTKDFENAKIQDSKAGKDQFLKQLASLESKLASEDLISNQK
ncbi:hypothetical protein Tco_1051519 [Tanacetum coccineum]